MAFNNHSDVKSFVKELIQELTSIGEVQISNELINLDSSFFTTSSEFLGELRLILEKIEALNMKSLKSQTKNQILECKEVINEAFRNVLR